MNISSHDLRRQKRELRQAMEAKRASFKDYKEKASLALRDTFLRSIALPPQSIVTSFSPRGSEIIPTYLHDALREQGHTIALPVILGKGLPLAFRIYNPGDRLVAGHLEIPEPSATAPEVDPTIILAPLLAFDRQGGRLGYGGGYYDRTITQLRQNGPLLAIGIGFDCQEVPEIPAGPHDAKLDKIATETRVF